MAYAPLQLAENITLLQKTCPKPIPPTRNDVKFIGASDGRTLSAEQELEIVSCLSYLIAYSDQPGGVIALCIEENADHEGLTLSIASNTGSVASFEPGVRSIIETLELQAADSNQDYGQSLLHRVIEHARIRLLRRLDYKEYQGEANRHFSTTVDRLATTVRYASKHRLVTGMPLKEMQNLSDKIAEQTNNSAKWLMKSCDMSSSNSPVATMVSLYTTLWVTHRPIIQEALGNMPNQEMNPSSRESLSSRLSHLAHYLPTINKLLRYAKRHTVFRRIKIRNVHIQSTSLAPQLNGSTLITQKGLLNRYIHLPKDMHSPRMARAINTMLSRKGVKLQHLHQDITHRANTSTKEGKMRVHAEIQLLLHYESNNNVTYPPRILKSSKDACFLCHLFVQENGKYRVPKTHGKVYELWALPNPQDLNLNNTQRVELEIQFQKFNNVIEELLLNIAIQNRPQLIDPRESGIFSIASSVTKRSHASGSHSDLSEKSLANFRSSASSSHLTEMGEGINGSEQGLGADNSINPNVPVESETRGEISRSVSIHSTTGACRTEQTHPAPVPENRLATAFGTSTSYPICLNPGEPYTHIFQNTMNTICIHTPQIHLDLSHTWTQQLASQRITDPSLRICIEATWLKSGQSSEMTYEEPRQLVDLRQEWKDMRAGEGVLFTAGGLLLRKREDDLRLRASYVAQE